MVHDRRKSVDASTFGVQACIVRDVHSVPAFQPSARFLKVATQVISSQDDRLHDPRYEYPPSSAGTARHFPSREPGLPAALRRAIVVDKRADPRARLLERHIAASVEAGTGRDLSLARHPATGCRPQDIKQNRYRRAQYHFVGLREAKPIS